MELIESFTQLQYLPRNLGIVALQLVVLGVALALIAGLSRGLLGHAAGLPRLQAHAPRLKSLRAVITRLLVAVFLLGGIALIVANGYLILQDRDILTYARDWLEGLGREFWLTAAIAVGKVVALILLTGFLVRRIRNILTALKHKAKAYQNIRANDESMEAFFKGLNRLQTDALWLLAIFFSARILQLPAGVSALIWLVLKIYLIVSLGLLALKLVSVIVDSLDALAGRYREPERLLDVYAKLRDLIPLMRRCLEAIVYVVMATLIILQMEAIAPLAALGLPLIEVIAIFFFSRVIVELSNLLVDRKLLHDEDKDEAEQKRLKTVVPIFKSILSFVIYFIAFVLMLKALTLNPWPILAGAGIAGAVIGLGAQPLVNDIVSGFFILFEKLFLVGDFIETGSARGTVESIELRTTRIRNPDGQLHILRNGQLGEVVNYSKGYTHAMVQVGVSYDSDLNKVYAVLEATGQKLAEDNSDVLEPTQVQGLDNFGESELTIRTITRVKPGRHRQIARQYRKMIKDAFDREGIEIPFARRVVIFQNAPPGMAPADRQAGDDQ